MSRIKKQKNYRMSQIRSKDSRIEKKLRSILWAKGLRFRIHYKKIPGVPDIVLVRHKIAIFCDSEFWHGYKMNEWSPVLFKKNKNFWVNKIKKNVKRDETVNKKLKKMGWKVLRFWGSQIEKSPEKCVAYVEKAIKKSATLLQGDKGLK